LTGLLVMVLLLHTSCRRQNNYPKPKAYPRLDYPHKGYKQANTLPYPITFDFPVSSKIIIPERKSHDQNWINLRFETFKATLLTSYIKADEKTIEQRILENESVLEKETPAYAHIQKQEFKSSNGNVTGYLYTIGGNTASPIQFILTDSKNQLFRGALYFDYLPNRDSISDIINGLSVDIQHLLESFKFKK